MFSIGEISKIVGISANALRYYDEIGLLKPSIIDENLYRYYSEEQIRKITYIIELKQYGFTLSEIKKIMENRDGKSLRSILEQKYIELQCRMNKLRENSILLQERIAEIRKKEDINLEKKKILIVDDLGLARIIIKDIVEAHGYKVVGQASNGKEAVALYEELAPDLIIMDIVMPEMDGIDAVREIMNRNPNVKIVMCSEIKDKTVIEKSIQAGASNYICKPITNIQLLHAIEEVYDENFIFDLSKIKASIYTHFRIEAAVPLKEEIFVKLREKLTGFVNSMNKDEEKSNYKVELVQLEQVTMGEFKAFNRMSSCVLELESSRAEHSIFAAVYGKSDTRMRALEEILNLITEEFKSIKEKYVVDKIIKKEFSAWQKKEDYEIVLATYNVEFDNDKTLISVSIPYEIIYSKEW